LWFARATTPLSVAAQEAAKRLVDAATGLLSHGRTTLFESWCVADVDLALMLQRLVLNGQAVPEVLVKYAKANWERPSLAKWHALPRGSTPV
jgi:glutathione S-transferase